MSDLYWRGEKPELGRGWMGMWQEIAPAARTNTIGWLQPPACMSHGSGSWKFKIRDDQKCHVLVRTSFWLADIIFLPCSHMLEGVTESESSERKGAFLSLLLKGTNATMKALPPPGSNSRYHHNGDLSFHIWILGRHRHSVHGNRRAWDKVEDEMVG